MIQEQTVDMVPPDKLLERVQLLRQSGYRLVQIGATRLPDLVELTYSFDLNGRLTNLRVQLPALNARVPSISSIYGCVILYENEIHDLFNVQIQGMAVDFHGHLYKTSVKFPFGTVKAPAAHQTPAAVPPKPQATPAPAAH
jgi:ech hydrogenase subunit D